LFVSSTARAHIEQAIVLLVVLVPLWVVLVNRIRFGVWTEVPDEARNGAWRPREVLDAPQVLPKPIVSATSISPSVLRVLPAAGLGGLVIWIFASPFHTEAPPIQINRNQAEQRGRQALTRQDVQLDSSWTVLSRVEGQPGETDRFVWQTAGPERYTKLLGVYVMPPSWMVRFARFHGDVAERAEQYQVYSNGAGEIFRVNHELPEAKPGKNLTEEEARMIAVRALGDQSQFKEVSAQAAKRPSRTDWTFVFKDTADYGLPQGEPRISIEVAGDQVTDTVRYVYVPEDWSRNERARRNLPTIFAVVCTITIVTIVVAGAIVGAIHWSRQRPFSARAFFAVFGGGFLLVAGDFLHNVPGFPIQASNAAPA